MSHIKLFESKKVRSVWNEEQKQWYFSIIDVIEVLTDSTIPKRYWSDLKKKLTIEGSEVYEKIVRLKMIAEDGKNRETDVADTNEWNKHDVKLQKEYAILTAEISKATFGITPSEFKQIKNLKRENLRDHMSDLELLFSMLGEASTTEIVKTQNPKGFIENKKVATKGGKVAGDARKALELQTGKKVVSNSNFLENKSKDKKIE